MLSSGKKSILINHVLQRIFIYQLSAIIPPKCVVDDLHKIFAKLYETLRKKEGKNTRWHGIILVYLKLKVDWILDPCLMCPRHYFSSYDRISDKKIFMGKFVVDKILQRTQTPGGRMEGMMSILKTHVNS